MNSNVLKKLHDVQLEILLEIDRICAKFNLNYFLIGGTLLGAVRHEGFIPWDDDLDIVMPRKDYNIFKEIVKKELNQQFFLHCIETDKNYPMPMPKIKKKNTVFEEKNLKNVQTLKCIYVDIFPLDNAKKEKSLFQTIQGKLQGSFGAIRAAKTGLYDKKNFSFFNKISYFLFHGFSNSTLEKWQSKIQMWNKNEKSAYFVNFASGYGYKKQTIKKSIFFPAKKIKFEGHLFNSLNNSDFFLKRIYGNNYMQLPPENKRITHNPIRLSFDTNGPDEELN